MRIQLLTALIAYMLVLLLHKATGATSTLWMVFAQLRATLFQRRRTEESYWKRRRARQAYIASVQPQLI